MGAGAQRGIEEIINTVLFPIGRFMAYYERLVELKFLRYWGKISDDEYETIIRKLTESRFLGAPLPDKPEKAPVPQQLPPKPPAP